ADRRGGRYLHGPGTARAAAGRAPDPGAGRDAAGRTAGHQAAHPDAAAAGLDRAAHLRGDAALRAHLPVLPGVPAADGEERVRHDGADRAPGARAGLPVTVAASEDRVAGRRAAAELPARPLD